MNSKRLIEFAATDNFYAFMALHEKDRWDYWVAESLEFYYDEPPTTPSRKP